MQIYEGGLSESELSSLVAPSGIEGKGPVLTTDERVCESEVQTERSPSYLEREESGEEGLDEQEVLQFQEQDD